MNYYYSYSLYDNNNWEYTKFEDYIIQFSEFGRMEEFKSVFKNYAHNILKEKVDTLSHESRNFVAIFEASDIISQSYKLKNHCNKINYLRN